MSAFKELPISEQIVLVGEEAMALDSKLVGQEETLKGLESAIFSLNELKEELEDAIALDPTGEKGLLAYAFKQIMHKTRNVNFLLHAHTAVLKETHKEQRKSVDLLLCHVDGEWNA